MKMGEEMGSRAAPGTRMVQGLRACTVPLMLTLPVHSFKGQSLGKAEVTSKPRSQASAPSPPNRVVLGIISNVEMQISLPPKERVRDVCEKNSATLQ